jgi:methylmalonyl-CoA mutase N-terminal domain/subunit
VVDPLGGAYYVEALTDQIEEAAWRYIRTIDEMGGMVAAVETGFPQREIADAAFRFQQQLERGERIIVGVNDFTVAGETPIPILRIDPDVERRQVDRTRRVRAARDRGRVEEALAGLRRAAEGQGNTMEHVLACVKAHATQGEICDVFRAAYGEYREPAMI